MNKVYCYCYHHLTHDSQFHPTKLAQMLASWKHCRCYTGTDTVHSKYYQIKSNAEEHKTVFQELVICLDAELWSREFSRFRNKDTGHLSLLDVDKHSLQNKICHMPDVILSPPSSLSNKASRLQIHHHLFGTSNLLWHYKNIYSTVALKCAQQFVLVMFHSTSAWTNRKNITISNARKFFFLKRQKKELFCPDYLPHIHRVQL